ncbi:MAG: hypothetical protein FWB80_07650 [Defluviitaleaceae bacterium]|nr:hypothetical protein [Defluviitaleaceae bacterium]
MGDLATGLPAYFGYAGVRAVKERGNYLLDGFKIHRSYSNPHEIFERYKMLNRLAEGFPYADVIMPATNGAPFITLGREVYVMTRHVVGREPALNDLEDITYILESIAHFHKAARGFECAPKKASPLNEVFEKQKSELDTAIKKVHRCPRLSDFDVLMLKNADAYAERVENAAKILEKTDYAALYTRAAEEKHLCHNALKEESFTIHENNCYISRFEETTVDLQLSDLASVLRRYARKSNREIPIKKLLQIYGSILPLPATADKIIYAQLSFPWQFLKISSQYYSKKRNFIPAAITGRMSAILDEQKCYDAYIAGLL